MNKLTLTDEQIEDIHKELAEGFNIGKFSVKEILKSKYGEPDNVPEKTDIEKAIDYYNLSVVTVKYNPDGSICTK